jgi:hypothetical protein
MLTGNVSFQLVDFNADHVSSQKSHAVITTPSPIKNNYTTNYAPIYKKFSSWEDEESSLGRKLIDCLFDHLEHGRKGFSDTPQSKPTRMHVGRSYPPRDITLWRKISSISNDASDLNTPPQQRLPWTQ